MAGFMLRFFIYNMLISGIIGIFLIVKRILRNSLSGRMQYNLWFLLLGLLAVPFIPFRLTRFPQIVSLKIFSWLGSLIHSPVSDAKTTVPETAGTSLTGNADWINDFALSVNSRTPSTAGYLLLGIWGIGMLAMTILVIKSAFRLHALEKSALPLQNPEVHRLYNHCLQETGIRKKIPIYSTAYIKSPFTVGFIRPRIYLPIHLISDYNPADCRFMLLHELQHYKHGDALINGLMNLVNIVYWFHPMVWYSLKEMRNDREIACDSSVLDMLKEQDYAEYGNTLIRYAEKMSFPAFLFISNLGGNQRQIRKRIINIASYRPVTKLQKAGGICIYFFTACLLSAFTPVLSVHAVTENTYHMKENENPISYIDLSAYFDGYQGCFVLFDTSAKSWQIYNEEAAQKRVSPDSTSKIYSALFALENGTITPTSNSMAWNGQHYPIAEWNTGQTLTTAFKNSVNWYFQSLDQAAGLEDLEAFYTSIHYGNKDLSGGISSYWAESSLKISPVEQVEIFKRLYMNEFHFDTDHVQTVKNALLLSATSNGSLYGKTGTGKINGENIRGWFIGCIETSDNTYFFALNISAASNATGSKASDIAFHILEDMGIWL